MDLTTTLILIIIGISLEACFSGSEIAMISLNRIKMQQRADEGSKSAQAVLTLLDSPEQLFSTTSFGTNLSMVTTTAIFTAFMVTQFGELGDVLSMILISPLIIFGGEIIPKIIFQSRANSIMLVMVRPLNLFIKLFFPIISLLAKFSYYFTRKIPTTDQEQKQTFNRNQIRDVISLDSQTIELGPTERKMIHRIFNFGEITVEQCMVPLVHITAVKDIATLMEAHELANESGFSRLPVFHDRMYNLIGILNTFDLLNQAMDNSPITDLIRPAYYIPPNKKIDDLLKALQQRGLHMAIVVDEHGGCIGIVTIEDLLEEIVGEIEDEYDKPGKQYQDYAEGGYLIEANMEIGAINDQINLNLPLGDYETLGGLVIDKLETIPLSGEQVIVNGYRLTVKEAGKRKIQSIIVRKLSESDQKNGPETKPTKKNSV